jgi:MFS family permease
MERGGGGTPAKNSSTWQITALLALAMFINYVDRGNLATAGPLLKSELGLSATQFGLLSSAFFWTYVAGHPFTGWLSERIGARRMLAAGIALWSLATIAMGFCRTFEVLLAMRLVLGLGESVMFPCSSQVLSRITGKKGRGRGNGAMIVGMSLGPAFGTFAGGLMLATVGWRAIFIVFGTLSLLWILPWLAATRGADMRKVCAASVSGSPRMTEVLRQRSLWGAAIGAFAFAYALFLVLSWLPIYLVKQLGFSVGGMAVLGGAVYVLQAVGAAAGGSIIDRQLARGVSPSLAYKSVIAASMLGLAISFWLCTAHDVATASAAMLAAGFFLGFGPPALFGIAQTFAGPSASAQWVGIQNALANSAGILAPVITGIIVDRTGSFSGAFALGGIVVLAGTLSWIFAVGRIAEVQWKTA